MKALSDNFKEESNVDLAFTLVGGRKGRSATIAQEMTCRLKKLVILAPTVSSAKTASLPPDYANFMKIIKDSQTNQDYLRN